MPPSSCSDKEQVKSELLWLVLLWSAVTTSGDGTSNVTRTTKSNLHVVDVDPDMIDLLGAPVIFVTGLVVTMWNRNLP